MEYYIDSYYISHFIFGLNVFYISQSMLQVCVRYASVYPSSLLFQNHLHWLWVRHLRASTAAKSNWIIVTFAACCLHGNIHVVRSVFLAWAMSHDTNNVSDIGFQFRHNISNFIPYIYHNGKCFISQLFAFSLLCSLNHWMIMIDRYTHSSYQNSRTACHELKSKLMINYMIIFFNVTETNWKVN